MKKYLALLLALVLLFSICACGKEDDNPNLGVYELESAEMYGISVSAKEVYEGGFTIELKSNGKCKLTVNGQSASGKWTEDGIDFTVSGGGFDGAGTLEDGTLILENVQDSGVNLTFVRNN